MSDVKTLALIPGAKVKFGEDYNYAWWRRVITKLGQAEVNKALQKFWTVIDHDHNYDIIYIDISEHLPVPKEEGGFFNYRFDQVKCYMSGEQND